MVGRFWLEDWAFFESADVLIDTQNFHLETIDNKRNVLNNASIEESVYFSMNDSLINSLKNCNSLRIRFNGEKQLKECIFDTVKLNMIKRWIDHIEKP